MSKERQPLLTEEQIEKIHRRFFDGESYYQILPEEIYAAVNKAKCLPEDGDMDMFYAFLRGKTKRVLNLDRLRADVKAWVDDPNRKYPEWWIVFKDDEVIEAVSDYDKTIDDTPNLCCYANVIGINPDDYFEEVEDGAHQEQLKIEDNNDKR